MTESPPRFRLSFQTKVLIPVLVMMALGPVVTLSIVNRRITAQVEAEAEQSLATARAVFANSLSIRERSLRTRFETLVSEPRFVAVAQQAHGPTMEAFLSSQLASLGGDTEALLYSIDDDEVLATAARTAPGEMAVATATLTAAAFGGQPQVGLVEVAGRLFHGVAIPVRLPNGGQLLGVLTIAERLGDTTVREIKSLTRTEVVLIGSSGEMLAGTIEPPGGENGDGIQPVTIDGQHFLKVTGTLATTGAGGAVTYGLLTSYEERLRALAATQRLLITVALAALVVGGGLIGWLIRRITHPLVELRDSTEAVGRGDFSQKIDRISNDECGELATSFNGMIANLQASRAELERTLQTLRDTQAQLVQSEKLSAVGQFVAGVAHELNNPLTTVVGYADLLKFAPDHPEATTYLDRIAQSAERCRKVVQNLLSFARQHPPERKPVELEAVCDAVAEFLGYELRRSGVELIKSYGDNRPRIIGDEHQLQQVVLNLVNNARQALEGTREDGCITMSIESEGDKVRIRIRDNGPGIAPEHASRLFDPFFTTKPEGKGTGLGLSLCYGIMQEHRGSIAVKSEPGQGAEFILEFPRLDERTAAATVPAPAPDSVAPFATPSGAGRKALVIDDEAWIREVAAEILRAEGYAVETAESGEIGLARTRAATFDLVVCDWKMPGINGIALYERLRVENPAAARGFLFMTGDVMSDGFQTFLKAQGRPCLPKPFAPRELRAAVGRLATTG